ncbi:MAG: hypothetical protein DIU67_000490 [Actinomycetes bacterium]
MSSSESVPHAPHQVIAVLDDPAEAQAIIADLEDRGIPPQAISLIDPASTIDASTDGAIAPTVMFGMIAGLLAGGILGLAADAWMAMDLSRPLAVTLGGVAGASIGTVAGGLRARLGSSSRERRETPLAVGVHHPDPTVVDSAEDVMAAHRPIRLHRQDR